jgi:general secretion pathway protein N
MRIPAMAALGAAAYGVFLVATVPASFVAARASAAAPESIDLTDTHGTLWRGDARARIRAAGGDVLLDRIEWRWLPARLASGRIAFDVTATGRGLDARSQVARGFTAWELRELAAHGDAAAVTALAPMIAPWRPEGRVAISSPAIEWSETRAQGDLHAEWSDAALAISEVRPLGSYRIDMHADGGPAKLVVATLSGPLRIAAQGSVAPATGLNLSGDARGEGAAAGALEPLLNLIGPRRPDGARALEIRLN